MKVDEVPSALEFEFPIKTIIIIFLFRLTGLDTVLILLAGPLVALPFALFWLVSGGRWMGLGDAKLALIVGWGLGISYGFTALMYSFWIGTIIIIGLSLFREMLEAFSTHNNAIHYGHQNIGYN